MDSSRSGLRGDPVGDNRQDDGTRDNALPSHDLAPLTPTQGREEVIADMRRVQAEMVKADVNGWPNSIEQWIDLLAAQPDPSRVPEQVEDMEADAARVAHTAAQLGGLKESQEPGLALMFLLFAEKWVDLKASSLSGSSPEAQLREALEIAVDYMHMWMENNTGEKELRDLERIEAALSGSSQSQPEG